MPGAPAPTLTSNPPWYAASTSPSPVLHAISALCAMRPASSLDRPQPSASLRASARDRAAALLHPSPYPTGTPISCRMSAEMRPPRTARSNSATTALDTAVLPGACPVVDTARRPPGPPPMRAPYTDVRMPCTMLNPAPSEPVLSISTPSLVSALKKPVTWAGQNAAPVPCCRPIARLNGR